MAQWDERSDRNEAGARAGGNGAAYGDADLQAQITEYVETARAEVDRYVQTASNFVRERPVACLLGAVAVGFLIGRIASRR